MGRFLDGLREHGRNFFSNWRTDDGSFATKLVLAVRNRAKALFSRAQCCGHTGEPGC